jgi:predicted kinase
MIILMAGLPGTGKSTLARELARKTNGAVFSKDEIRAAIFSPQGIEYSTEQDDFCMEIMLQGARYLLTRDPQRKVFLDGRTFSRRYQLNRVLEFANELQQPWVILECVCSSETARRRLEAEVDSNHPARNRTYDLYLELQKRFEPITLRKTMISSDEPIEHIIRQALGAIQ